MAYSLCLHLCGMDHWFGKFLKGISEGYFYQSDIEIESGNRQ